MRGNQKCSSFCDRCEFDCNCDSCKHCHTCFARKGIALPVLNCPYTHSCGISESGRRVRNHSDLMTVDAGQAEAFNRCLEDAVVELNVGTPDRGGIVRVHRKPLQNASGLLRQRILNYRPADQIPKYNIFIGGEMYFTTFDMFLQYVYLQDYQPPLCFISGGYKSLLLHAQVYLLSKQLLAPRLGDLALDKGRDSADIIKAILTAKDGITPRGPCEGESRRARAVLCEVVSILYTYQSEPATDGKMDKFRVLVAWLTGKCFYNLIDDRDFVELGEFFPSYMNDVMALIQYQSQEAKTAWEKAILELRSRSQSHR